MSVKIRELSVLALLAIVPASAGADSFIWSVKAETCEEINTSETLSSVRYRIYDKAALLAVKASPYLKQAAENSDDHVYSILAYKLADNALTDVNIITTKETADKICVELSGTLDKEKANKILAENNLKSLDADTALQIAKQTSAELPKSLYETDKTIPLLFIRDMEYYNNKTTSSHTEQIAGLLSFEPRVLVTENEELADYFIVPKLKKSHLERIDKTHSRYSMSVETELQKPDGTIIDSNTQNRYIVIDSSKDTQEVARRMLSKLVEETVKALSPRLNSLID